MAARPSGSAFSGAACARPCVGALLRFERYGTISSPLSRQLPTERVPVEGAVAYQPLGRRGGKTLSENYSDKGDFMRRNTLRMGCERKTMSVCQTHELSVFARFVVPTARPFFRDEERAVGEPLARQELLLKLFREELYCLHSS